MVLEVWLKSKNKLRSILGLCDYWYKVEII